MVPLTKKPQQGDHKEFYSSTTTRRPQGTYELPPKDACQRAGRVYGQPKIAKEGKTNPGSLIAEQTAKVTNTSTTKVQEASVFEDCYIKPTEKETRRKSLTKRFHLVLSRQSAPRTRRKADRAAGVLLYCEAFPVPNARPAQVRRPKNGNQEATNSEEPCPKAATNSGRPPRDHKNPQPPRPSRSWLEGTPLSRPQKNSTPTATEGPGVSRWTNSEPGAYTRRPRRRPTTERRPKNTAKIPTK